MRIQKNLFLVWGVLGFSLLMGACSIAPEEVSVQVSMPRPSFSAMMNSSFAPGPLTIHPNHSNNVSSSGLLTQNTCYFIHVWGPGINGLGAFPPKEASCRVNTPPENNVGRLEGPFPYGSVAQLRVPVGERQFDLLGFVSPYANDTACNKGFRMESASYNDGGVQKTNINFFYGDYALEDPDSQSTQSNFTLAAKPFGRVGLFASSGVVRLRPGSQTINLNLEWDPSSGKLQNYGCDSGGGSTTYSPRAYHPNFVAPFESWAGHDSNSSGGTPPAEVFEKVYTGVTRGPIHVSCPINARKMRLSLGNLQIKSSANDEPDLSTATGQAAIRGQFHAANTIVKESLDCPTDYSEETKLLVGNSALNLWAVPAGSTFAYKTGVECNSCNPYFHKPDVTEGSWIRYAKLEALDATGGVASSSYFIIEHSPRYFFAVNPASTSNPKAPLNLPFAGTPSLLGYVANSVKFPPNDPNSFDLYSEREIVLGDIYGTDFDVKTYSMGVQNKAISMMPSLTHQEVMTFGPAVGNNDPFTGFLRRIADTGNIWDRFQLWGKDTSNNHKLLKGLPKDGESGAPSTTMKFVRSEHGIVVEAPIEFFELVAANRVELSSLPLDSVTGAITLNNHQLDNFPQKQVWVESSNCPSLGEDEFFNVQDATGDGDSFLLFPIGAANPLILPGTTAISCSATLIKSSAFPKIQVRTSMDQSANPISIPLHPKLVEMDHATVHQLRILHEPQLGSIFAVLTDRGLAITQCAGGANGISNCATQPRLLFIDNWDRGETLGQNQTADFDIVLNGTVGATSSVGLVGAQITGSAAPWGIAVNKINIPETPPSNGNLSGAATTGNLMVSFGGMGGTLLFDGIEIRSLRNFDVGIASTDVLLKFATEESGSMKSNHLFRSPDSGNTWYHVYRSSGFSSDQPQLKDITPLHLHYQYEEGFQHSPMGFGLLEKRGPSNWFFLQQSDRGY